MNVPIWLLAIAPPVAFLFGFLVCAMFTAGKVADTDDMPVESIMHWQRKWKQASDTSRDHAAAHARAADALATKQARIDRALACETPKAAHGVRKMAAILRGDA